MSTSSLDCPDRTKSNTGFNSGRKVRVVAKIRAFTGLDSESPTQATPWISVQKPGGEESESVAIAFGDQSTSRKETYQVDYCYEQHEDNCLIFSREIKPLISGIFDAQNATIIAYGARGSGKTYSIQGSDDKPGLAVLAIAEILSRPEKIGKSVFVSYYEVYHDHVYDLLDVKRQTVSVLEDAQGNIQLKGLSQVCVKSIVEFQKLYSNGCSLRKPTQKNASELPRRSHKGLMIQVSSSNDNSNFYFVGKMNFVDLAGYEDARRKSIDASNLAESTRINKSLYALQNVVYALNANESRVPYRESKLTRMLQGSLGGTNKILMITCLNPSFCQDTIYVASLASRSCQGINRECTDSSRKPKSSARSKVISSSAIVKPGNVVASAKKQTGSRLPLSEKKSKGAALVIKGRKLFDESNHLKSSKQENSSSGIASANVSSLQAEKKSISDVSTATLPLPLEEGTSPLAAPIVLEPSLATKDVSLHNENNHLEVTSSNNSSTSALIPLEEGHNMDKENKSSLVNEEDSPPLSKRLLELANNMKSLLSSTPSYMEMRQEDDISLHGEFSFSTVGPKNLVLDQNLRVNDDTCSSRVKEKAILSSTPSFIKMPQENETSLNGEVFSSIVRPETSFHEQKLIVNDEPEVENRNLCSSGVKENSLSSSTLSYIKMLQENEVSLSDEVSSSTVGVETSVHEHNLRVDDKWEVKNYNSCSLGVKEKSLLSSTQSCMKMAQENETSVNGEVCSSIVRPETPFHEQKLRVNDEPEVENRNMCSSVVKENSLSSSTPSYMKMSQENDISLSGEVSSSTVGPKTSVHEHNLRVNDKWEFTNYNLCSSGVKEKSLLPTPSCMKMPQENATLLNGEFCSSIVRPETSVVEQNLRSNDKWAVAIYNTPQQKLNTCTSGMKEKSLLPTPSCMKMAQENETSLNGEFCSSIVRPETSVVEQNLRANDKWAVAIYNTPQQNLNTCTSGMKEKSLLSSTPSCVENYASLNGEVSPAEQNLRANSDKWEVVLYSTPQEKFNTCSSGMKEKYLLTSTPSYLERRQENGEFSSGFMGVQTPVRGKDRWEVANYNSPWEKFNTCSSGMKETFVNQYLNFLNTANKEELKGLKGIGEKRASYILQLREQSPEPFKNLDSLRDIGLSAKQVKVMMKTVAGELFN